MLKRSRIYLVVGLVALVVAVGSWLVASGVSTPANAALAEYQIDKMTCGSCVGKIESALSELDGVSSVEVNVTSSRGRVTYDPAEVDSQLIADTISATGYPARLRLELSADEYTSLQTEQAQLGQEYMARIGDRLLARADFDAQVKQRSTGASGSGPQALQATWKDVLQRELMLASAEQNKIVIQDGEVDIRLEELKQRHNGLEQLVTKRYGSMENFRARLREDMIINRNIEDYVYAGINNPRVRQEKLQTWYAELQNSTEVIIFDPQLKALSQGGGAGCACCSS